MKQTAAKPKKPITPQRKAQIVAWHKQHDKDKSKVDKHTLTNESDLFDLELDVHGVTAGQYDAALGVA